MTTNTTPPPPAPVSTFAGVNYDLGQLSQEEAAFIDFARKLRANGGINFFGLSPKLLKMFDKCWHWSRQGQNWGGVMMSEDGILKMWNLQRSGRSE